MDTVRLCSLSEDVLVEWDAAGRSLHVVTRWGEFALGVIDDHVRDSLRRMSFGPVSLENAVAGIEAEGTARAAGRGGGRTNLMEVLDVLRGSVVHSLALDDGYRPLLSVTPVVAAPVFDLPRVAATQPVRLSRFAVLRPCGGELALESPRSDFRVELHQPLAARLATALAVPRSPAELAADSGAPQQVVADVVAYLLASGAVLLGDKRAAREEDHDPALRHWSHHELHFHSRSRSRQRDAACDTDLADHTDVADPVVKPPPDGPRFPLYRPDLSARDHSLTELLEADHACPEFSSRTLTGEHVGELLFRSARVRTAGPQHLPPGMSHEASQRPYFNIACLYELELYVSVDRCTTLPRGIYHYDPSQHELTLVNSDEGALAELLDTAKLAAANVRRPPALITVTTRMARLSPMLGGAAYATTLTHLGALQQTLYLVARSMGLSVHLVPTDAGDRVARLLRLEWPGEVSIGECVIDGPS
nr:SagB family peptide dehydrogenase [Haloechinothrix aidingensis]